MFSILVVDDERLICEGMRRALERQGLFEVYVAANGREALSIIQSYPIDAMLLDISMPEMNGLELMQALARAEIRIATIIISGYEEFDYAKQALSYGAVDYILKPIDSEDALRLSERLFHILSERAEQALLLNRLREKLPPAKPDVQNAVAERCRRFIEAHFSEGELSVNNLSAQFNYSPNYLGNIFKRAYNLSVNDYINQCRVDEAKRLMDETRLMIYEIAFQVGFRDQHYFSRTFKKCEGVTPSEYREQSDR